MTKTPRHDMMIGEDTARHGQKGMKMITAKEYNNVCVRPDMENGESVTVGKLIEILSHLNPDCEILIGTGINDCEDSITRIIYSRDQRKPGAVLFATDPNEPEDE